MAPEFKKKVFFTAIGLILAFIFAETILRVLGYTSLNRHTTDTNNLIIFKPNQTFSVKERCYSTTLQTNSRGFHSKEYPLIKPENTFRIVIVGDSFVESAQVLTQQTFFELLEKKLNESSQEIKYEVIAIGKSGHGALINTLFAREYAMQYNPDMIIGTFITNDLQEDFTDPERFKAIQQGQAYDLESLQIPNQNENKIVLFVKDYILERSRLFERWLMHFFVVKKGFEKVETASVEQTTEEKKSLLMETLVHPTSTLSEEAWKKEALALNTFHQFTQEKKIKFLLVHLTEGFLIEPKLRTEMSDYLAEEPFYEKTAMEHLESIASNNKFSFFSTQPYFETQYKNTGVLPIWSCDQHYNLLGHEWIADSIFEYLKSSKLLPSG